MNELRQYLMLWIARLIYLDRCSVSLTAAESSFVRKQLEQIKTVFVGSKGVISDGLFGGLKLSMFGLSVTDSIQDDSVARRVPVALLDQFRRSLDDYFYFSDVVKLDNWEYKRPSIDELENNVIKCIDVLINYFGSSASERKF